VAKIVARLRKLFLNDDGPTAVEYAVLLGLLIAVALVAIRALGGGVEGKWQKNAQDIISATNT
jgi:Flp pilus assembly pilin Flp